MPFTHIDAATMWNNGKAYFFSGDHYARYNVTTDKVYPLPTQPHWPGMPFTTIGASIMWTSPTGATLVFEEKVRDNQLSFVTKVRSVCRSRRQSGLADGDDVRTRAAEPCRDQQHRRGRPDPVSAEHGAGAGHDHGRLAPDEQRRATGLGAQVFLVHRGRMHSYTDLYLAAFYPIAMGRGNDFVCGSEISPERARAVRHDNLAVVLNGDGVISVGEFRQWTVNNLPAEVRQRLGI